LGELTVRAVMTTTLENAPPHEPLITVVERMSHSSISCLIVVDDDRPIGIVTERDIVKLCAQGSGSLLDSPVAEYMTAPVHSIPETMTLSDARKLMKTRRCRRFPVVEDDGTLVGLVTQSDILDGSMHSLERYSRKLLKMVDERTEELCLKNAELERLSITDSLTGLFNRRFLYRRFEEELSRARRLQTYLGCVMIDIDHFKQVNDSYGHGVGDGALRAIGDTLRTCVRQEDVVARYGGEEFVVVGGGDHSGMLTVAERVRTTVASRAIPAGKHSLALTVSCGVTSCSAFHEPHDVDELIRMADEAMYAAKSKGRNRSEVFHGMRTSLPQ
jgi:diguanylate cyclase (GGDEF)-like protein